MTSKDMVLDVMRSQGTADAQDLRSRSADMDGTAIIAEEQKVPAWNGQKDYSDWPVGGPVRFEDQVYTLITPHNASSYPDANPGNTPALWSITHTKDLAKAKPYLAPNGTSGMYMLDEVCTKDDKIWISLQDNNPYPPGEVRTESYWAEYQEETEEETPEEPEPSPEPEPEDPDEPVTPTVPEFVQPTGTQDAYSTGDQVLYNGQVYESKIDNNVWSPDDYPDGWTLVEE